MADEKRLRRMIRPSQLKDFGLKETQVAMGRKAGTFPQPVKIYGEGGHAVAYYEDELIEWQERLPRAELKDDPDERGE